MLKPGELNGFYCKCFSILKPEKLDGFYTFTVSALLLYLNGNQDEAGSAG